MDHVTSRFADSLRGTRGRKRDEERAGREREGGREKERRVPACNTAYERASARIYTHARAHTRTRNVCHVQRIRTYTYLGESVCGHVPVRVG